MQIRFSRAARGEKPENNCLPFWFYGETIRTSVHGSHAMLCYVMLCYYYFMKEVTPSAEAGINGECYCGSAIIGMPSCVFHFFTGAIAVEARRWRAASARIYIFNSIQ